MIEVLVVDDDFMVAKVHSRFVDQTPGFTVVGSVHTGAAALQAAHDLEPDLILLDIYLPDMTGLEVLNRLRDQVPDVDVLVISAAREVDTVRRALRGGIVHYLLKPFTYEDLRERLEHYQFAHLSLAEVTTARQADVDRVFGTRGSPDRPLPKGLSVETAQLVERALRECAGDMSASECASALGLSRVSARRYLEHFATLGRADVRLRYGGQGRPERRYAWRRP
jgi:response regulator of citrate/malate metabolism